MTHSPGKIHDNYHFDEDEEKMCSYFGETDLCHIYYYCYSHTPESCMACHSNDSLSGSLGAASKVPWTVSWYDTVTTIFSTKPQEIGCNDGGSDSKAYLQIQIATCRWAHVTFFPKASYVEGKIVSLLWGHQLYALSSNLYARLLFCHSVTLACKHK